jgi:hypothetical protein
MMSIPWPRGGSLRSRAAIVSVFLLFAGPSARGDDDIRFANPFPDRSGPVAEKNLKDNGGNAASEAAVALGLQWLALHQADDGHWSLHEFNRHAREKPFPEGKNFTDNCTDTAARKNDIGATGLALLPFLGAGMSHQPDKKWKVDYSKTVKGGLEFLMRKQDKKSGFFGGDMYAHGIATLAMCEAYGLSSDPALKASAQKAIDYIDFCQDPKDGGWRYAPKNSGDLCVTGWQLTALKTAHLAGLKVKEDTWKRAELFVKTCEAPWKDADGKEHKGGYSYLPGTPETPSMTAVGMVCKMYFGWTPRNPELISGAERLKLAPPSTTKNLYYDFYATQVMFFLKGDSWTFWNLGPKGENGMRDSLIRAQDTGADKKGQRGSWAAQPGAIGNDGGRLMATSLSLLCLEVYYRHPRARLKD